MTRPIPQGMVKGRITKYFPQQGKNFGFIDTETLKGVFFHNTQQRHVTSDCLEPIIEDYWHDPAVQGEEVFLVIEKGEKGPRAKRWIKAKSWYAAWDAIEQRKIIRFVERTGRVPLSRLQERAKYRTLWQGKSLRDLRINWRKGLYEVHGSDRDFSARYFEEQQEDGSWVKVADPR
jgi:cold shock CspA family protein